MSGGQTGSRSRAAYLNHTSDRRQSLPAFSSRVHLPPLPCSPPRRRAKTNGSDSLLASVVRGNRFSCPQQRLSRTCRTDRRRHRLVQRHRPGDRPGTGRRRGRRAWFMPATAATAAEAVADAGAQPRRRSPRRAVRPGRCRHARELGRASLELARRGRHLGQQCRRRRADRRRRPAGRFERKLERAVARRRGGDDAACRALSARG